MSQIHFENNFIGIIFSIEVLFTKIWNFELKIFEDFEISQISYLSKSHISETIRNFLIPFSSYCSQNILPWDDLIPK